MEETIIIQLGNLVDWLKNRNEISRDDRERQTKILNIRTKINNAIQDMPVHEGIAKLLSGTYINYFHCKKIVEILKETEADSKNFFGRYGSQRMKDWQEIINLYEKNNLYLSEIGQMLFNNYRYEIPSLKNQIEKFTQREIEWEKKKVELMKSENIVRSEFNNLCKQLGITANTNNIKKELCERIVDLPDIYDRIVKKTMNLDKVVEFYTAFVELTLGRAHDGGCVPMIQYINDKGNTTVYEWTYGEPPLTITPPAFHTNIEDEKNNSQQNDNEIDFDVENEIDFGENIEMGDGNDINWGDVDAIEANMYDNNDIDYNLSLEESGIVVEAAGHEGGNATGNDALTIIDNPSTRNDFIDQLLELEAFLKLRLFELKNDGSNNLLSMSRMQGEKDVLQFSTAETTQNMLDNVQIILSEVLDSRVQHLYNIKHFPRYLDELTGTLKQKLLTIDKIIAKQKMTIVKRDEIAIEKRKLQPILEVITRRTQELQNDLEKDLSKHMSKKHNKEITIRINVTSY
ncbi:hypothetical protein PV328_007580 [Microctonus aethiopoides]|uniref:CDK5 regulatory subunit-associated protein 3 n=1 Tax=Microctonus aethiopoides TaxID=144406 RepID=A0AA39C9L9_9HYME|nr:hypothetical protein PV328_007580 [Microctonus aethiopoides]